jgi:IS5 family transposase
MLRVSLYPRAQDEVDPDELRLAPDSFERRLRDALPKLVSAEDFVGFYAENGAGSRCPIQQLGMEMLKYRHNLSDKELVERCRRDLGFRYAIGLRWGEYPPGTATLGRSRAKLRALKGDDFVPRRVLKLAVEEGFLTDTDLQAVDSTNTDCRGAVIDTFNLVAAGIRQVVREVARCLGTRSDDLAQQWDLRRYMARSIKGQASIDWSDEAARNALITEEIRDADRLVKHIAEMPMTLPPEIQEAIELLQCVACQDVEELPDGTFRIAKGTAPGRIISATDPEARHGRKSSSKVINGFKTHITGTIESQFVTGIVVTDAATHDAEPTSALIDQAERNGVKPKELVGDSAYGTGANIRQAAGRGVQVLTKLPAPSHKDSIPKREFDIDLESLRVTCPGGRTTSTFSLVKDPGGSDEQVQRFHFDKDDCQSCEMRTQCCKATAAGGKRTVTLNTHEHELQQLKKFNDSERAPHILRNRSAIERLISHLVRMGMRHARFFGMLKVQFQAFMTAAAYNLQRLFTLTAKSLRSPPT